MKIFIYYKAIDKPWGGSNSFIKAFKNYIEKKRKDIRMVEDINKDYDIFFMNGCSKSAVSEQRTPIDLTEIKRIKKLKRKIIYRLDGLRTIYAGKFDLMDQLQLQGLKLADYIIFQSKHCLQSFRHFGYCKNNYSIIRNGVDQNIFNLKQKKFWDKKNKLRIFSTSWSPNLNKGFQTIASFSENKAIKSYFVGNWPDKIDKKKVICLPPVKQKKLAEYYKEYDVFLHAAKNDPCPNVVLEALSCGLPVIYHNSGGTPEIIKKYGIPLPEVIDKKQIKAILEKMKKDYDISIKRIKRDKFKFSINYVAEKYIEVFQKCLKKE